MNKILSILRVKSFVNIKIVIILFLFSISFYIGSRYIYIVEGERNSLISNIKSNEKKVLNDIIINSEILQLDNRILSKSLDVNSEYDSIYYDINKMILLVSKTEIQELINIVNLKKSVFIKINEYKPIEVNLNKVKSTRKISIVSTDVSRGLFRKKVRHDTLTKKYSVIDNDLYLEEYSKKSLLNSSNINYLIKENNQLSLDMKLIIDSNTNKKMIDRLQNNNIIFNKLRDNIRVYVFTTIILLLVSILFLYLISRDFRKIRKSSNRKSESISILIENSKK